MSQIDKGIFTLDRLRQKAATKELLWREGKGTGEIRSRFRRSGIILHISSLPSPYGIGTMGEAAKEFIDFLAAAGQSYWQVLPLSTIDHANSPYKSYSTRAGNEFLIDIDDLREQGLLPEFSYESDADLGQVDFCCVRELRKQWFAEAFEHFTEEHTLYSDFREFCVKEAGWLSDYALFMTIKEEYPYNWQDWPDELKYREVWALDAYRQSHQSRVDYYCFLQFFFFRQWQMLKQYATSKGVAIIGDIPIYVSDDCVDVWCMPQQFLLDEELKPISVAGCPPDYFSEDGQLWGNPLYNWDFMQSDKFTWWIERIEFSCRLFDILRIDHFRGLESYWAVPADSKTAREGTWCLAPGQALFDQVYAKLGKVDIIAEDLGLITPEVNQLRRNCGFPGMKVLLFAFSPGANSDYLPHNLEEDCVLYLGTHDNNTVQGWYEEGNPAEVDFAVEYLGMHPGDNVPWRLIQVAMTSVADNVMVQMQDYLGLGSAARMNVPGTSSGNWSWRMLPGVLTPDLACRIKRLVEISGRH